MAKIKDSYGSNLLLKAVKLIGMKNRLNDLFFALILILSSVIVLTNCDTAEPPPLPPAPVLDTVTVNIIDQTHRSLTVDVKTTANNKDWRIELWRNYNNADTLAAEFPVMVGDTTIIDDNNGTGLLLDTEYGYYAVVKDSFREEQNRTAQQTGRTLAATSHNYTWEEITIGDNGFNNTLYDVWCTDENNVYAVGLVKINGENYGLLHWDGSQWKPEKGAGGYAIFGFSENDIWTAGGGVFHYNGVEWKSMDSRLEGDHLIPLDDVLFENTPYTSLWGTSSSNLYLGNQWGKIIHWDGEKAKVVYDSHGGFFDDMYGIGLDFIIAVGNNGITPSTAVLKKGTSWEEVPGLNTNSELLETVFIQSESNIYISGSGSYNYFGDSWHSLSFQSLKIRGNESGNNIFAVGYGGRVYHYNGIDWKKLIINISSTEDYTVFHNVKLIGNKIFIVGTQGDKAIILIGKR